MKIRPELEVSDDPFLCGDCEFKDSSNPDWCVPFDKIVGDLRCHECIDACRPCVHKWKRIQHGVESTKYEWCEKCGTLRWKPRYHQNMGYRYEVPSSVDKENT